MSEIKESFAEWKQRIFFDHGFLRALYPNIWKIDEKFFRSAQPSPSLFVKFKNKGIKTIINLRGSRDDLVDQMERRVCQNLNLNLIEFKLTNSLYFSDSTKRLLPMCSGRLPSTHRIWRRQS